MNKNVKKTVKGLNRYKYYSGIPLRAWNSSSLNTSGEPKIVVKTAKRDGEGWYRE